MALQPLISRPASTGLTRLRVGPNRVTADRSLPAMCAPYPGDKSTNASNKNVLSVDCSMMATYSPAAAPTQLTGITTHALALWNITASEAGRAPDVIPGDIWEFLSKDNVNGSSADPLTNSGLLVLGVYVTGTGPYDLSLLLYNSTAGTLSTPAAYIPLLLVNRFNNLSTDPNPIP